MLPLPLALLFAVAFQDDAPAVPLLPHDELGAHMQRLASASADATVVPVGTSRGGRAIEALRFGPRADGRPAVLLVANLEGPRVFESGVALHHAARLAAGEAPELLADTTVYVVPRANPDPAEARWGLPQAEVWSAGEGGHGVDNDRDGLQGEDPPADVNGDGLVTTLRVEDPEGTWIEDPTDPRVLVEADPTKGERGRYKVYPEGRDLDGDERIAEDPPTDAWMNRNFAAGWGAHTPEGGLFPTDEPEALALMQFVLDRPEIALVVVYDGLDWLVEAPKSVADDAKAVKRIPPAGILASDAALLKEIARRYAEVTENEATDGGADDHGTFQRWCYDHRGLPTLALVLWEMPTEIPEEFQEEETEDSAEDSAGDPGEVEEPAGAVDEDAEPSDDAKRLAWADALGEDWRFDPWTAFEHPELGPVEVGGFTPYARLEPPVAEHAALADAHFTFFAQMGEFLPRLRLAACTATQLGDGMWRVEAAVENPALLPMRAKAAVRAREVRPARVELVLPEAASLVAGRPVQLLQELAGSGGRAEFTWLVSGPPGLEFGVRVATDHAGILEAKAEVIR